MSDGISGRDENETVGSRRPRRAVGLGRVSALFVSVLELALLVAVLSAGSSAPLLSFCLVTVFAVIAVRTALVGCRVEGQFLRVRSWFRTYRFSRASVVELRSVNYSGFGNRFSKSHVVSMVSVEITGRRLPLDLRFTADTPRRVRGQVALLRRIVMPGGAGRQATRSRPRKRHDGLMQPPEDSTDDRSLVVRWDPEVDAGYLALAPIADGQATHQRVVASPREGVGEVVLDFGDDGRLLGIEFIGEGTVPLGLVREDVEETAD